MQGNLAQISLTDILLLATGGKKSGVLKLTRGKETVEIYFEEGAVVHATCPIGDGEKALLYPVTWGEGTFSLLPNGTPPGCTVKKSSSEILDQVKAMTREWQSILEVIPSGKTVFTLADPGEDQSGAITVPHIGWRVLTKTDGVRSVQEIAESLRIPYAYAAKVIFNLYKARLLRVVTTAPKAAGDLVSPTIMTQLAGALTDVIGPMAPVILRDQIEALGEAQDNFPEAKLDELLGSIAQEISDSRLRNKFEQAMLQEISSVKRF
jgi:hypothetical protein